MHGKGSGLHSNGFSLVRKWHKELPKTHSFVESLLKPTKIYHEVPSILAELEETKAIHALANITGGGISGNLPRIIPNDLECKIDASKIPTPTWMREYFSVAGKSPLDVESVFNIGAGMICVVADEHHKQFEESSTNHGLEPVLIGQVVPNQSNKGVIYE